MKKQTILMAVYNPIEVDGRVKRISDSLAKEFKLILICPKGNEEYKNPLYRIRRVKLIAGFGRSVKLLHFWIQIIKFSLMMRPKIIYVHDFFLPFPGWLASKLINAKFIYDAHELIVPSKHDITSKKEKIFYTLEKAVINQANLIIAANPERSEIMKVHYKLKTLPTTIRNIPPVPNIIYNDLEIFTWYPELKKIKITDVHVIYMGDISYGRGLKVLIETIDFLPYNFKMFIVGKGPDLDKLRKFASVNNEGRLIVIGPVSHEKIHDIIRMADIGYLTYSMNGLNNLLCAPNKIFEYAQAGLPIVSTCQLPIKRYISEFPIGLLIGCDSKVTPLVLSKAFIKIAEDYESFKKEIDKFLLTYTWKKESGVLIKKVKEVLE